MGCKRWASTVRAVAAGAGVFLLAACASARPGAAENAGGAAVDPVRESPASIRISHDLTGSVTLNETAGGWVVAEDGFPADSALVAQALAGLSGLHDNERVAGADARLAYGLDSDRATVVEMTDGEGDVRTLSLARGKESYGTTYWLEEGRDGIFRVDGNKSWGLSTDPEHWKSRTIFPPFAAGKEPWGFRMTWRDSGGNPLSYRLVRLSGDSAILVEPDTMTMPSPRAFDLLGRLMQIAVDDFIEGGRRRALEKELSGNDSAIATVTVWMEDGERLSTRVVGRIGEHYYVVHPSGSLALMKTWRLEDLMVPPGVLATPLPLGPEPDDGTGRHLMPAGMGVFVPHGFEPGHREQGHSHDEGESFEEHPAPHGEDDHDDHDHGGHAPHP